MKKQMMLTLIFATGLSFSVTTLAKGNEWKALNRVPASTGEFYCSSVNEDALAINSTDSLQKTLNASCDKSKNYSVMIDASHQANFSNTYSFCCIAK